MKTLFFIPLACLCLFSSAQVKHIVTDGAQIRKEDQPIADVIGYISRGDTILVNSFNGGYWNIKMGKIIGFVSELYMPATPDIEPIKYKSPTAIRDYQWPTYVKMGMSISELVHLKGEYTEDNKTSFSWGTQDQIIYRRNGLKTEYYYF
jgi:hypothetical protein